MSRSCQAVTKTTRSRASAPGGSRSTFTSIYKLTVALQQRKLSAAERPKTPEEVALALANMPLTSVADAPLGKVDRSSVRFAVDDRARSLQ